MSKVAMPEPHGIHFSHESTYSLPQMEAYKDACVREYLEEAAKICWEMQSAPEFGKDDKDRWLAIAESRIRALIPPTE